MPDHGPKFKRYQRKWYKRNKARISAKRKPYNYESHVKHNYGLSLAQVEKAKVVQNNLCKICKLDKKLVIDHDHLTNHFRGLLCNSCNRMLGFAGDNPQTLEKGAAYLRGEA